jgi:Xaa-Pro aminopeptidase
MPVRHQFRPLATFTPALVAVAVLGVSGPAGAQTAVAEYATRRDSLAVRIDSGIVIAFGGRTPVADAGPFVQVPAFRYLTGYEHADAALIMVVRRGRPAAATLLVHRTAPRRSLYYGIEPDSSDLARELGLASRPAPDLTHLADSLAAHGWPFFTLRDFAAADFAQADSLTRGRAFMDALASRHSGLVVRDAHPLLDRLRARKSPVELALIRKAAEISGEGHLALMRAIEPGMHEYDLQAIVESTFLRGGAERPAYGSIVGSGPNGTVLHYMKNRRAMRPGELVVIDAGAEYRGYAADITRTLPVSGTFTPEQRALYQIVLDAELAAERNSGPGLSMQAAHDSSFDVRAAGMARLGLVESPEAQFDPPWPADCTRVPRSCRQAMLFAIHGITHGLGLEVHDPLQAYFDDRTFAVGDAFTIEPGIYVSSRQLDMLPDTPRNRAFASKVRAAVERYEGTGVRIEDDYVITERGLERITLLPRELDEVEALTRKPGRPVP